MSGCMYRLLVLSYSHTSQIHRMYNLNIYFVNFLTQNRRCICKRFDIIKIMLKKMARGEAYLKICFEKCPRLPKSDARYFLTTKFILNIFYGNFVLHALRFNTHYRVNKSR